MTAQAQTENPTQAPVVPSKSIRLTRALRDDIIKAVVDRLNSNYQFQTTRNGVSTRWNPELNGGTFEINAGDETSGDRWIPETGFADFLYSMVAKARWEADNAEFLEAFENAPEILRKAISQSPNLSIYEYDQEANHGRGMNRMVKRLYLNKEDYIPYHATMQANVTFVKDDPDYVSIHRQIRNAEKMRREYQEDWKLKVGNLVKQTQQIVESVNTTRQLMDIWPEVVNYFPDYIRDPSTITLPALVADTSALNEALASS